MRRALILLACLLSFICFAEPGDGALSAEEKIRLEAEKALPYLKTAQGCKVLYEDIIFSKVLTTLPPEQEKELLGILAQLQMARQLNHIHDYDIDYADDHIFTSLIFTAPDGKLLSVDVDFIGFVGDTGDMSDCKDYELPDEKTYRRFCQLVDYEYNKETIIEENREFLAQKEQELRDLRRASKCRLVYRSKKGEETIPLSPEEESEILSMLPRLYLAPAEAVVVEEICRDSEYCWIFTCGDKEVELKPYYTRSDFEHDTWDLAPYMLDAVSYTRLQQLSREDSFRASSMDISVGDKLHVETLRRAAAHIGYTMKEPDAKSNTRQTYLMPTRILSLSKNNSPQEAQLYLNADDEVYAIFLSDKNSSPKRKDNDGVNSLYIDSAMIYVRQTP